MISPMQDELTLAIANDLGITGLPPEKQQELIAQFGEVALKAATLAVVAQLTPEKRDEFAMLAEAGDAKTLSDFLNKEVPNHEALAKDAIAGEVRRFRSLEAT